MDWARLRKKRGGWMDWAKDKEEIKEGRDGLGQTWRESSRQRYGGGRKEKGGGKMTRGGKEGGRESHQEDFPGNITLEITNTHKTKPGTMSPFTPPPP